MTELLITIGASIVGFLLLMAIISMVFSKFYIKSTKDQAFIRTGGTSAKVIKDGGAFCVPFIHSTMPISLTTSKLTVKRNNKEALITKDRIRVDISADFFIRVKPDKESIEKAAESLGEKASDQRILSELVEPKLVDALRATAANMELDELHVKRQDFVQRVLEMVSPDLEKNGLELETASLTHLDQTSISELDENNIFDAEGLRLIAKTVEEKKKERNDIERTAAVQIEQRNLSATREQETLRQQRELIKFDTDVKISERENSQKIEIAQFEAESRQKAELANIETERKLEAARLEKDRNLKVVEEESLKATEIAKQERQIAINEKSRDESKAKAEAENARADVVRAEEAVKTAQSEASAEREKTVALIKAKQEAEEKATFIRVAAEAELEVAQNRAKAVLTEAEAESKSAQLRAEGVKAEGLAQAETLRLHNEAQNQLSQEQTQAQVRLKAIEKLPELIRASTEAIGHIDSLRVVDVTGLNGGGQGSGGQSGSNGAESLVNAALNYRTQRPIVDSLLHDVGLGGLSSLDSLVAPVKDILSPTSEEVAGEAIAAETSKVTPQRISVKTERKGSSAE